ncbi:hypothetical protein ARMGADRAFT_1007365 [Armillaria gallica]|uniref:Heterokaryon incompatibility domain-containing protein n=1 Tax=Armillaria gallica TaxID=47427 RepID=A0A2H3E1Q2_ARMGA|nr:hypothetical protein ARMGADRAFT_1007365 [Armillaria gallica]
MTSHEVVPLASGPGAVDVPSSSIRTNWHEAEVFMVSVVQKAVSQSTLNQSDVSFNGQWEGWKLLYAAAQEFFTSQSASLASSASEPVTDYGTSFSELLDILVEHAESALYRMQVLGYEGYEPDVFDFVATTCSSLPVDGESPLSETNTARFLSILNECWEEERKFRWTAVWSPMPWSSASRMEQPDMSLVGLTGECAIDFSSRTLDDPLHKHLHREYVFSPSMAWLECSHDGHHLCDTLGSYTKLRRKHGASRRDDAALWQSAMTFGLLEAAFNIRIPEDFLLSRGGNKRKVLTSDMMSILVFDWLIRFLAVKQKDQQSAETWSIRIQNALSWANNGLAEECLAQRKTLQRGGIPQGEADHILCVTGTILETLSDCAYLAGILGEPSLGTFTKSILADTYIEMLIDMGWCPFSIHKIVPRTLSLLAYATTCDPPVREHPDEHRGCTPDICGFYNVDGGTYKNRHSATCDGNCRYLIPSNDRVMDFLEEDEIPVILVNESGITVHRASSGPYIAISHVWADGLGSTTEKGLPACQVARIASLTSRLIPGGAFWMDALCVPELRKLRKKAIRMMARTYRQAHTVLVIDAGISACPPSMHATEKLFRIKMSGWMQRLWTLQEGMLARRLVFQISDEQVEASSFLGGIIDEGFRISSFPGLTITPPSLRGVAESVAFLMQPATDDSIHTLGQILGYLEGRATSKAEDETVAISGLLGLDPGELYDYRLADDRMRAFLLLVRKVPRGLPFTSAPKLTFEGFRWAPRSIASIGTLEVDSDVLCTAAGLEGEYTLISFKEELQLDHEHNGAIFRVSEDSNASAYTVVLDDDPPLGLCVNAILLHASTLPSQSGAATNCAVVSIHRNSILAQDESTTLACDYGASASLTNLSTDRDPSVPMGCGTQMRRQIFLR